MRPLMPPVQTPDNLFHDGNPLTGELGTIVDAEHLNNVQGAVRDAQSELITVLTAAGINVDPTKQNQLLTALKALLLSRSNPFGDIKSDGAAAIATALTNLGLGTAATKNVGNGANQIPTMANFTSGPGWMKFPDGTIMQFGTNIAGQISFPTTIIFPVPFTSGCRIATSFDSALNTATDCPAFATSPAGTGLFAFYLMSSRTGGTGAGANWIAIGK
ncbi:gp53-like domain-containing protein [Cronobacter sakazakii]